jgi:hypothetical protein
MLRMMFPPRLALALAAGLAVLAPLGSRPAAAAARIYPEWSLGGTYSVDVPPGFASVAGNFSFPMGADTASLTINYDDKTKLNAGGLLSLTLFSLKGTFTVDDEGAQHVHLIEFAKTPGFTFDGVASDTGSEIVGTYMRSDGALGIAAGDSGPLTITRTDTTATSAFDLDFRTQMDTHGRVKGAMGTDGKELKATLKAYGFRIVDNVRKPRLFDGGRVRGKVVTKRDGTTAGTLTIAGKGWSVKLAGPIDADGFHALASVRAGGFVVNARPVLLPAAEGPPHPPNPPPPPPKNQLTGAVAVASSGRIAITHNAVPSRFFGTKAAIEIDLPANTGVATVHADPASWTLADPDARKVIVKIGSATYGTLTSPAGVTLEVRALSSTTGGAIEILATGTVVTSSGRKKTVNVLLKGTVL